MPSTHIETRPPLPVAEALDRVLAGCLRLEDETVSLDEACGRVLAASVRADVDMPPFDRAAMDGFAVCARDVAAAPLALPIAAVVKAGDPPDATLSPGTAIRIMTGAPVPRGADAVIPVEQTRAAARRVEILAPVEAGRHVSPQASEVQRGDRVLAAGRRIDAAAIAVLAAFGVDVVKVARRPRVAILVTGDEIVPVAIRPTGGQIRNSNGPAVAAQAREAGADVTLLGVAGDTIGSLREHLAPAFADALNDVIVVSGGVSAGDYDLVEDAFAEFGVAVEFDAVAIKPGKPLVFGRGENCLVFGLPGNPVSAQVTFDVFVRAALLRMQGAALVTRPEVTVVLDAPLRNPAQREFFAPVTLRRDGERLLATPVRSRGSADLVAHACAEALAVVPADRTRVERGDTLRARLLGRGWSDA